MWCEQAEIKWARRGIFIVGWCNSGKLSALAAQPFQSRRSGALTRMWRWRQVQPSQKELAIGAVHSKNEGMLLQLLSWRCIESVVFACPLPSTWRWPEVNMCMEINLVTFQYIDGFGCYHFCLNRNGLELIIFFCTSGPLSVQFWDCRLL